MPYRVRETDLDTPGHLAEGNFRLQAEWRDLGGAAAGMFLLRQGGGGWEAAEFVGDRGADMQTMTIVVSAKAGDELILVAGGPASGSLRLSIRDQPWRLEEPPQSFGRGVEAAMFDAVGGRISRQDAVTINDTRQMETPLTQRGGFSARTDLPPGNRLVGCKAAAGGARSGDWKFEFEAKPAYQFDGVLLAGAGSMIDVAGRVDWRAAQLALYPTTKGEFDASLRCISLDLSASDLDVAFVANEPGSIPGLSH